MQVRPTLRTKLSGKQKRPFAPRGKTARGVTKFQLGRVDWQDLDQGPRCARCEVCLLRFPHLSISSCTDVHPKPVTCRKVWASVPPRTCHMTTPFAPGCRCGRQFSRYANALCRLRKELKGCWERSTARRGSAAELE